MGVGGGGGVKFSVYLNKLVFLMSSGNFLLSPLMGKMPSNLDSLFFTISSA